MDLLYIMLLIGWTLFKLTNREYGVSASGKKCGYPIYKFNFFITNMFHNYL